MIKTKYYFEAEGNSRVEVRGEAIKFANSIAVDDASITRIVLYIDTKENASWFDGLFSKEEIKELYHGRNVQEIKVPVKIETKRTYNRPSGYNDVVVCFGTSSKDLYRLEDMDGVKYMILVPWLKSDSEEWVRSRSATNAETKESISFEQPTPVVVKALEHLTKSINLVTGISHPLDERLAKTYIRALHTYEEKLDGSVVEAYLVNSLNWSTSCAQCVKGLIDTLNEGRSFKGGETKGLSRHYKRWQKEVLEAKQGKK